MVPNCVLMENVFASVEGCLQTSCSFLSSTLFLKESRTSPSYPPQPDFYKYKRTAAHAKGQTSSALVDRKALDATGVGVFLCITSHIQICCYFEQSSPVNTSCQKNWSIANLASILFTRYFASVASAQGTEIHKQLSLYHNHAALQHYEHVVASGSPILPVKCRAWAQPTHYREKTNSVDYIWPQDLSGRVFEEVLGGGKDKEIPFKKQLFSWLKENQLCLELLSKLWNSFTFAYCTLFSCTILALQILSLRQAAHVHTACSSIAFYENLVDIATT